MENYFFDTEENEIKGITYYVLIIYDIRENRQRIKLAKLMKSFGFRVQKSAFETHLTEGKYQKLISKLALFIQDKSFDSIRVYKIRGAGAVTIFGKDDSEKVEDVIII